MKAQPAATDKANKQWQLLLTQHFGFLMINQIDSSVKTKPNSIHLKPATRPAFTPWSRYMQTMQKPKQS